MIKEMQQLEGGCRRNAIGHCHQIWHGNNNNEYITAQDNSTNWSLQHFLTYRRVHKAVFYLCS